MVVGLKIPCLFLCTCSSWGSLISCRWLFIFIIIISEDWISFILPTSLCQVLDGCIVSLLLSLCFLRIYLSLSPEEEWEKELEAELQDYEVVADGNGHQDSNWENQIQEMLDAEEASSSSEN